MGHFCLCLHGHTTQHIPFDSAVDEMKAWLEELPNIGQVDALMTGPLKEMANERVITFVSNLGYFSSSACIVDDLDVVNELSTTVQSDNSALITVETIRNGAEILGGQFWVTYDNEKTTATLGRRRASFQEKALRWNWKLATHRASHRYVI